MANVIQEYLVSLGFAVDQPQLSRFNDVLRVTAREVEEFTGRFTRGFVGAGVAVTSALTSVAGATLGVMDRTAQADLQYQIFARRMFISADAARTMKIATDALGYSLEDIIWGPAELRERYKELVDLETRMFSRAGGGQDMESQMRKIRDIRFEFTKMRVEAQVFAFALTRDLSKALFGDENSLLTRLRQFNDWFQRDFPSISSRIATSLVPVLHDVRDIFRDIFDIGKTAGSEVMRLLGEFYDDQKMKSGAINIENIGLALHHIGDSVKYTLQIVKDFVQLLQDHPYMRSMVEGAIGSSLLGAGPLPGAILGPLAKGVERGTDPLAKQYQQSTPLVGKFASIKKSEEYLLAMRYAAKYHLDPFLVAGIIDKESGWDPNAVNRSSGASGLMQLMPGTAAGLGLSGSSIFDAERNIEAGTRYLSQLLDPKLHPEIGGDVGKALKAYGGFVTKDPSGYVGDVLRRRDKMKAGGFSALHPSSYSGGSVGATFGDIHVHVNHPGASAEEIGHAVATKVDERLRWRAQFNMANASTVFA